MIKRIIVGTLLITISVFLILHSKWAMALLIFPVGIAGGIEFYNLAILKGIKPSKLNGVTSIVLIYLGALLLKEFYVMELLTFLFISTLFLFVFRKDYHISCFLDASVTILGYIYVGWFFSLIFQMREVEGFISAYGITLQKGAAMVLFLVLVNSFTDTGSYFIGKAIGKRKLCPHISPNKTVGGSLGGVLSAIVIALILGPLLNLSAGQSIFFGFVISIFAQMGDLWESTLKRDVAVKDSGDAIPGHGGVLDRFDSLFISTPVAYYLFKYMIGF